MQAWNYLKSFMDFFHIGKEELIAVAIILLFILIFFKPTISGDGYGYYAIIEGIFQDQTLNFERQTRFTGGHTGELIWFNEKTDRYVTKYAIGLPIFSGPLYTFSLFLDNYKLFHVKDNFFIEKSKDILIHQLAVCLTSLVFVLAALLFTSKILAEFFKFKNRGLLLLLGFFGTPFTFYATYGLSYSHAAEAGLFSIFLFLLLSRGKPALIGFSAGLLFITRYSSGIFMLPVLVSIAIKKKFKEVGLLLAGFLPLVLLTMAYFLVQFGSPFSSGYESFESIFPIHFFQILFDINRGIIIWSPLILVAVIGLLLARNKYRNLLLSFIFLNLLVYGSWVSWEGAWSFGNRFFIILFPVYCIGLGLFLKKFSTKKARKLLLILMIYSLVLFLLFMAQREFLADPTSFFNTIDFWFVKGNLHLFPVEVLKKTSFFRFVFSI